MKHTIFLLSLLLLASCNQVTKEAEKKIIKKELTKELTGEVIEKSVKKKALKNSLRKSLSLTSGKVLGKTVGKDLSKASIKAIKKLPESEKKLILEELEFNPGAAKIINADPKLYISTVLKNSASVKIPSGRSVLAVKPSKDYSGKYYPEINNLGSNGKKYCSVVNARLLKARRAAITTADQVAPADAIAKCSPGTLCLDKAKDAGILQKNMLAVMGDDMKKIANAFGGFEAHHIIPGDASFPSAVKARKLMEKLGLNINHPANGVFLPEDAGSIFKGYIHKGGHTEDYYNSVWNAVKNCKTQKDLLRELNILGKKLASGDKSIALYNNCAKIA